MTDQENFFPLSIQGELTLPPSRALWLIKWLLIIPHIFLLAFLWIAYAVVTVVAFFSILFTGKYPRRLFDFNLGVLRWTWRVGFYSYMALGTDRYPPFSLKAADYPAGLKMDYPEKLSHWLVLVKWVLAIPHFAVLALLIGEGHRHWEAAGHHWGGVQYPMGGLLWILVVFTALVLLFTGKHHRDIFRLIMGINRWAFRVAAYASFMTDRYPPFRLWE